MKIIVLIGKDDTGKSSTIREVIAQLIDKGATVKWYGRNGSDNSTMIRNIPLTKIGRVRDINILLEYHEKYIGITTYGDSQSLIQKSYNRIYSHSNKNLDIFICAAHNVNVVIDLFNKLGIQIDCIKVEKGIEPNKTYQETVNINQATNIVKFI